MHVLRRHTTLSHLYVCLFLLFTVACGNFTIGCGTERAPANGANAQTAASPESAPASKTDDERAKIVCLGDSLTAGLGLLETQSYPYLLQKKIEEDVSPETPACGLRRLDWALQEDVRVLIVALGANDGLRGLAVAEMKENLGK